MIHVLAAKRAERRLGLIEARRENAVDERGHPLTEDRTRALGAAVGKVLNQQARHQQDLESFAETIL